jgi:hypothetical protein
LVTELRHHIISKDAWVRLDGVVFAFSTYRLMNALLLLDQTFKFVVVGGGILRLEEVLERVFAARGRRPAVLIALPATILRIQPLVIGRRVNRVIDGIVLIEIRVTVTSVGNRLLQSLDDVHKGLGIVNVL